MTTQTTVTPAKKVRRWPWIALAVLGLLVAAGSCQGAKDGYSDHTKPEAVSVSDFKTPEECASARRLAVKLGASLAEAEQRITCTR